MEIYFKYLKYHATPILIISVSVIVLLIHETDEGTPQIKQNIHKLFNVLK